eukprot:COSAG04_NODE_1471_length_6586_cov_1.959149_2_plen_315_part_00
MVEIQLGSTVPDELKSHSRLVVPPGRYGRPGKRLSIKGDGSQSIGANIVLASGQCHDSDYVDASYAQLELSQVGGTVKTLTVQPLENRDQCPDLPSCRGNRAPVPRLLLQGVSIEPQVLNATLSQAFSVCLNQVVYANHGCLQTTVDTVLTPFPFMHHAHTGVSTHMPRSANQCHGNASDHDHQDMQLIVEMRLANGVGSCAIPDVRIEPGNILRVIGEGPDEPTHQTTLHLDVEHGPTLLPKSCNSRVSYDGEGALMILENVTAGGQYIDRQTTIDGQCCPACAAGNHEHDKDNKKPGELMRHAVNSCEGRSV